MATDHPFPDPTTRLRLDRLDVALDAFSRGLARLLEETDPAPTSLELPADADLSVPAGEPPALDAEGGDGTDGRSA